MAILDTYCRGEILGNPDISGKGVGEAFIGLASMISR